MKLQYNDRQGWVAQLICTRHVAAISLLNQT